MILPLVIIITLIFINHINSSIFTLNRHLPLKNHYLTSQLRNKMLNLNNKTSISLGNGDNYLYYITMQIGTPPQQLNLQFDTGSNIMWIALPGAGLNSYFNYSQSLSFNNTSIQSSVQYVDGSGIFGTMGSETLQVSNTTIDINQTILWANNIVGLNFPDYIAGLVGMGFTNSPNFLDLAYQYGQIKTSAFTLSLRSTSSQQQSYLYYNQIPEFIKKQTAFLPVFEQFYWQVQTVGVVVGGIQMSELAANVAVIDSGTSYFYLNTELFNEIISQFFQKCDNYLKVPICLCKDTVNWPAFSFLFDGIEVYIQPNQYIGNINQTYCTYNFGSIGLYQILLGDIFFFAYDITYSKITQEIGFAGNITYLDKIIPVGKNIAQYCFAVIMFIVVILGSLQFYWLSYLTYDQPQNQGPASNMQIVEIGTSNLNEPLIGKGKGIN